MNIEYDLKDDRRRAVLDLVKWFGFRKSLMIMRWFKQYRTQIGWTTPGFIRFPLSIGGAEGYPVTMAWQRWAMGVK